MSPANPPSARRGAAARARSVRPDWPSPAPPPVISIRPPWSVTLILPDSPDVAVVRRWMHQPHLVDAWRQAWSIEDWSAEVRDQLVGDHSRPFLVRRDGEPVAYVELYRVAVDVVGEKWPFLPDEHALTDLGLRVAPAVAGPPAPELLAAIAEGVFAAEPACERIVATPPAGDDAVLKAHRAASFVPFETLQLPDGPVALTITPRPPEPIEVERTPAGVLAALQEAYDRVKPDHGRRLTPADDLFADLDLDSLDVVDLIDTLEGSVDVAVIEAALDQLTEHRTVADLIAFVLPRL